MTIRQSIALNFLQQYMRYCLEDFFDIVEPCINLDNKKLGPSILPLVFVGCPIEVVHTIILYHHYGPLYRFMVNKTYINNFKTQVSIGDIITTADLSSIRHSIYAAPQPLAVAAEVILQYLAYEVELVRPLTSPKHKLAWVQRPKPQNRIATDYLTSPWTPATFYTMKNLVLNLLNALLWVIPKAGFSEEILLYSKRSFSQFIYQGNVRLVHRVRKRLDEYTTRVRKEKLKELGQRIENGDVNALVEKSRMLYLDGQD
ncbi:hypothetical protein D9619_011022 [Psilocybe cf. subviscida]|uniref:Uncharacterized protein n=1 Tax=Psilocybe cf. subviscida TaxID=2480587 RepID=A0A8H5B8R7_9AGAR|nr:hypothetical protein D9619_011022 [Psilocybe cf. subviscida]